ISMSSQRANSRSIAAYTAGSACSMPPTVSSEKTTPNPNVSSASLRSHTVISCSGPSCRASREKYRPPGPPPITAMRTVASRRGAGGAACPLAQPEALQLSGGGVGQLGDELHRPRVLVRRDLLLDELLQLGGLLRGAGHRGAEHDVRGDDFPAVRVRPADDTALQHVGVAQQGVLHLRSGDVVAGRDDHVVAAGDVPEVAVRIAPVRVTGDVPTALDVRLLPRVRQVAAPGRAAHRQPP